MRSRGQLGSCLFLALKTLRSQVLEAIVEVESIFCQMKVQLFQCREPQDVGLLELRWCFHIVSSDCCVAVGVHVHVEVPHHIAAHQEPVVPQALPCLLRQVQVSGCSSVADKAHWDHFALLHFPCCPQYQPVRQTISQPVNQSMSHSFTSFPATWS